MSGVGFFIVSEGEASVSVDGSEVATIGPGDHFGELALISEGERTATVTATTRLRLPRDRVLGLPPLREGEPRRLVGAPPVPRRPPRR